MSTQKQAVQINVFSWRGRVSLLVIATLLIAGLAAAPLQAAEPQAVKFSLDWVPNTNHTGIYVALDKGWYAEKGLAVEIQTPSDPTAALKQVAYGHTDFGVSFQEEITIARSQKIPVVSIAAIIQHNTGALASLKETGIKRPKDFEGKRYAFYGSPLEEAVLAGLMACDGADVKKLEFVNVGFDAFPALLAKQVDFIWLFMAWDGVRAEMMGKPLEYIPVSGDCVPDYYTPVLMAGEKIIAERPEVVRKFLEATVRGYEFAIQNPEEAAEILIKHAPEGDPELIRRSQAWLSPRYQADAEQWGIQKLEVWQKFGDWMAERNLLPGPDFKAEEAFTNEFLPQRAGVGSQPAAVTPTAKP
jgi:ABC-type nitrate/sulfonate/bicarbonate transport system substrate-binding protein